MGIYVNPNNQSYADARLNPAFVDKSELLHYTNSVLDNPSSKFCCVSCPRRFGKSTTAAMLRAYYSTGCDSDALFDDLKISKFPDYGLHRNQYPLVYLDIQKFRSSYLTSEQEQNDPELLGVIPYLQETVLAELATAFPDVLSFPEGGPVIGKGTTLAGGILKICMEKKLRFIFVIDEWDCFFREDKDNTALQKKYILLLCDLFKGDIAESCIHLVYMTGILPIKKYGTESALNHFQEYSMIQPGTFAPYIGFSESDVEFLWG